MVIEPPCRSRICDLRFQNSQKVHESSAFLKFVVFVGLEVKEAFQFHVITYHSNFYFETCGILKLIRVHEFIKYEFSVYANRQTTNSEYSVTAGIGQ